MNKKLLLFFVTVMSLSWPVWAQQQPAVSRVFDSAGQWTWMTGNNATLQFATYGTKGVAAATNTPGARISPACWKDKQGNFWMFGGQGYGAPSLNGDHSDLWKYEPATNMWTWVGGSGTTVNNFGNYGTKGVAAATNWPGSRRCPMYWEDTAGNFWMFGGYGYAASGALSRMNDLWKYDPKTAMWTWVSGTNTATPTGNYGTMGQAAATNIPGGRGYAGSAVWIDSNNNFWMFGGQGQSTTTTLVAMNDLWKYEPVADMWTWVGGTNLGNQNGVYGTQGSPSTANIPGGRGGAVGWVDAAGMFWMYGGNGYTSATTTMERLSDLWKYNPITNEWTWVSGGNVTGSAANMGNYGTRNVTASTNRPGGRSQPAVIWKDSLGHFYMLGGYGYGSTSTLGPLNDIWKFNPVTAEWTWIEGSNVVSPAGVYGTKGIQSPNNNPGARSQGAQWVDNEGNLWIFGGSAIGTSGSANFINDLWKLIKPCSFTTNITAVRPTTFCNGDSVVLKANTNVGSGYTYQWKDASGTIAGAIGDSLLVKTRNSYTVSVSDGNCIATSLPVTVTVNPPAVAISPAAAEICLGKDTALTASGGTTYAWSPSTSLSSATGATVRASPSATTTYTVTVTDGGGCTATATRTVVVNALPAISISPAAAAICVGKDTALTASNGNTYVWTPATYTGNGATIRANPTITTTYTVTGTDTKGCSNTATREVIVDTIPTISITPATARICTGKDTALTASGGAIYSWSPANSLNSATGAIVRAHPTATITYTVTGTDAHGCSNTDTRTVTVDTLPVVRIMPGTPEICKGNDTALTASGATTYAWQPATSLNVATGATVRAFPTTATTYTVTGTDAHGCSSIAQQTVFVHALPVVTITGTGPMCSNATLTLTGSNGGFGTWHSNATSIATINTLGLVTGVSAGNALITYTYTDSKNCTASDTELIIVNAAPPVPGPISGKVQICNGDSSQLSNATPTGIWSSSTPSVVDVNAATGMAKALSVGNATMSYTVTNANNCSNAITTAVSVHALPNPPAAIMGATSVCVDASVALTNATAGGVWSSENPNALMVDAQSGLATGKLNGNALVKYTITDGNGCRNLSSLTMTVYANPIAGINPSGTVKICDGDTTTLNALPGGQGMSYQWQEVSGGIIPGATSATYDVSTAGQYQVIVTDINSCKDTSAADTVEMYVVAVPVITLNGQTLSTGSGYSSYQWYASGQPINGATQSSCIITQNGSYYVVVTDSNGCSKESAVENVTTLGVAMANGGANDVLVYPNPAHNTVHVVAAIPVDVCIMSMDGKSMLYNKNVTAVDINGLADGVYMMRIMDKNGILVKTQKLVKATGY